MNSVGSSVTSAATSPAAQQEAAAAKCSKMAPTDAVKAAFEEVEAKFQWDAKITKWLLSDEGFAATSISDFLYAISGPEDIAKIVEAAAPQNAFLMKSRVRQAWLALKKTEEKTESL